MKCFNHQRKNAVGCIRYSNGETVFFCRSCMITRMKAENIGFAVGKDD